MIVWKRVNVWTGTRRFNKVWVAPWAHIFPTGDILIDGKLTNRGTIHNVTRVKVGSGGLHNRGFIHPDIEVEEDPDATD